jgi:hypothetical protein
MKEKAEPGRERRPHAPGEVYEGRDPCLLRSARVSDPADSPDRRSPRIQPARNQPPKDRGKSLGLPDYPCSVLVLSSVFGKTDEGRLEVEESSGSETRAERESLFLICSADADKS